MSDIADATSLTRVDVRRSLQGLEASGVLTREDESIRILDREQLREIAHFDQTYLQLRSRPQP